MRFEDRQLVPILDACSPSNPSRSLRCQASTRQYGRREIWVVFSQLIIAVEALITRNAAICRIQGEGLTCASGLVMRAEEERTRKSS
jgi:hypothetical protein